MQITRTMAGQLPEKYMDQLESWIGTGPKIFTLLYKITKDGCNPATFHQKCANQGPTVTVLYNQQDSVYGGYVSAHWNSGGAWVQDANAFLFQLKYSGTDTFTKFPIRETTYALYGGKTYGPLFGMGHDLLTFLNTVNSSGGYFALKGQMKFGCYNNQDLSADQVNNGNMNVTELEVYRVTDGQRNRTPTQPWRKTPEWNEKFLEKLTEDIVSFKPSCEFGLSDVRILMLGPVGAGKSSFYNTINSVFKGRISQRAPCRIATHGITLAYTPYEVNVRSGATLNFRLCDTRGLEVTQGIDNFDCSYLLNGNIPDYYEFNPAPPPIIPDNPGFVHQPRVTEKIYCVVFVIDTATVGDIPPKLVKKINSFQRIVNRKGIPQAALLTKVDLACQDVAGKTSNVFTSKKIEAAVDKVSGLLGLPRNNILPVKNYENEMQLDDNISILSLLALRQLLHFAEDYIENLQVKMKALKLSSQRLAKSGLSEKSSDFIKE
ncbi:interferon-induced protein 44-like [Dreissena polymorpha]|uniref:TLDc domain-containing protein n=1 Tax=Dreissena polymorpha TaxID=45954 RepID=A0A9D4C189_DREPO|nr:interferon-induced protein 44-like [Dreissena polymorpha]KAH3715463.1 hypothetical protein DPMN_058174 [Dreissena polymorpha]